jgi:hypothetical protein
MTNEPILEFAKTIASDELIAKAFTMVDLSVSHHGVKGMKWGVRKDRAKTSTAKKSASQMTDAELKAINKRLNLERDYKRMMAERDKENQGLLAKGAELAAESIAKAGRQQLDRYVQNRVEALVKKATSS